MALPRLVIRYGRWKAAVTEYQGLLEDWKMKQKECPGAA